MRLLKNLFLVFLILSSFVIEAQNDIPQYTVRIGTFVNPKPADFDAIRSLGFVYAEKQPDDYYSVLMGGYTSKSNAQRTANQIKGKGFSNPLVTKLDMKSGETVTMIQLGLKKATQAFKWGNFLQLDELYVILNDNQVKVLTGIYPDVATAKAQLSAVRAMGFKDAFVKNVNSTLLHEVKDFEMWGEKRALIPLVFRDDSERKTLTRPTSTEIPEPFDDPQDRIETTIQKETIETVTTKGGSTTPVKVAKSNTFERSFTAATPNIRANEKRNSALELQKVLKAEGTYTSSLDGYYGKGTKAAYEVAILQNRQIQKYKILAKYANESSSRQFTNDIDYAINNLWAYPDDAMADLAASNEPLAKAYRAYFIFTNEGADDRVNNLMNAAIQQAFSGKKPTNMPRFDYNATYSYNDLNQLLLHLRYIHEISNQDIAVPCWLFQKHTGAAMEAFSFSGGSPIRMESCGGFWEWEEVAVLSTIATDMDSRKKFDTEELAKNKTQLNQLFLAPDPLSSQESKEVNTWHKNLWKGIDGWAFRDPLLEEMGTALKLSYFQVYVLLEDYYMDEGYNKTEAKGMALTTLKALVGYHLQRFV